MRIIEKDSELASREQCYKSIIAPLHGDYDPAHVLVNWKPDNDDFYRVGFLLCATMIADKIIATEFRRGGEAIVYPMLYCLRHFVELCCKRIVATAVSLGYYDKPKQNHDLKELWRLAREAIEAAPFVDLEASRERIEYLVDELARLDERSTTFRYAMQDGKSALGDATFKIDARAVRDHLDLACGELSEYVGMMEAVHRRSVR